MKRKRKCPEHIQIQKLSYFAGGYNDDQPRKNAGRSATI